MLLIMLHLLYENTASLIINWYQNILNMKRFIINKEDDPFRGFTVNVGEKGMRIYAAEYWKCSENGIHNNNSSNSLKFVVAESFLDENEGEDKINRFIKNHGEPGIQHIAFSTSDIKYAVRLSKQNGGQFLAPCRDYYSTDISGSVIEACKENLDELRELGILIDDEADAEISSSSVKQKLLMQVFTKSIFKNNSCFLEFIERRGATGFGRGNIRALWKIYERSKDLMLNAKKN